MCGIVGGVDCDIPYTGYVMDDTTIRTAVDAWLADATAAEATYGHISTWETGGVTDMEELFEDASSFNEDIGEWDISGVTTMEDMFRGASAFDQDLGWCVDDGVDLDDAFDDTPCESTSCGVKQGDGACAPTPRPTPEPSPVPGSPTQRPSRKPTPKPSATPSPRPTPTPTPAPTPAQTLVQVDSSVTLAGIVATEFNADEGMKDAFAQSVLDSANGLFEEIIDIEAAGRRRLDDGAGVDVSYTGVARIDGTETAEADSADLLQQSTEALGAALDDGSFLSTLQAADAAFAAVKVDLEATQATLLAATVVFVVTTPAPTTSPVTPPTTSPTPSPS